MVPTVEQLRQAGYRVKVRHYRVPMGRTVSDFGIEESFPIDGLLVLTGKEQVDVYPRGGVTEVELLSPNGMTLKGTARCNPKEASYNKKLGVKIAIGRALVSAFYAYR